MSTSTSTQSSLPQCTQVQPYSLALPSCIYVDDQAPIVESQAYTLQASESTSVTGTQQVKPSTAVSTVAIRIATYAFKQYMDSTHLPGISITGMSVSPISKTTLRLLIKHMKFTSAMYCDRVNMNGKWDCGALCQGETSQLQILSLIKSDNTITHGSSVGMVALQHRTRSIIVTFRGMIFPGDWDRNHRLVRIDLEKYRLKNRAVDIPKEAKIHEGFLKAYMKLRDQVNWSLQIALGLYPEYSIFFSGHSLGGVAATLAAIDSAVYFGNEITNRIHLFTFGSPRIGNKQWATWVTEIGLASVYRVAHISDPVPHMPSSIMGYQHISSGTIILSDKTNALCTTLGNPRDSAKCMQIALVNPDPKVHVSGYFWPSDCRAIK
ncbi:hypothetical protein BDV3_001975 [Batrachochytrium dendrobatidis]|nr:hypothetical protein BDEG_26828 [Batrachochytrium dendrobatidis JEL423]